MAGLVMHFDAITIDTQTVFNSGFRFESGLLAQLAQFKSGPTAFIVTDVVAREIRNHLAIKTREASEHLVSARAKAELFQVPMPDQKVRSSDELEAEADKVAEDRLKAFFEACGATTIGYESVSLNELMERYFKASPPFATSGKKKNEFPDAVSLLSIEKWASRHDKAVLAVTNDGDWKAFADQSERIYVVSDLGEALQKVQDNLEETRKTVGVVFDKIADGSDANLQDDFRSSLAAGVNGLSLHAEASSFHHVEAVGWDLEFLDFTFDADGEGWAFDVVRVDGTSVTVRAEITARVAATAEFSFSVFDSIDRDYVGLGSTEVERETDLSLDILVTLADVGGEVSIQDIEVIDNWVEVNFGEVEPDYGDYEE